MESNNIKNHLKVLTQISVIDRSFGESEKKHIYAIGKANKLSVEDIDEIVTEVLRAKDNEKTTYEGLMSEERFNYLYDIIQLMKIDGEVFLTEIKYCEEIAERLGYDRKVVEKMAPSIYSNPAITADRESLMEKASKYLK